MDESNKTLCELMSLRLDKSAGDEMSHLVSTAYKLMNKKLSDFTIEDLRLMIGQQIGLSFLVPLALDILENDPFVEGDFYEGDLLMAVLRLDGLFWKEHLRSKERMNSVIITAKEQMNVVDLPDSVKKEIDTWRMIN